MPRFCQQPRRRQQTGWLTIKPVADLRGVITDWGGVMTNPIAHSVNAWLAADGISRESYVAVMRQWVHEAYADGQTGTNPIHALERGECTNDEFELALARELVMEDGGRWPGRGCWRACSPGRHSMRR